jgi:hypothetical protein
VECLPGRCGQVYVTRRVAHGRQSRRVSFFSEKVKGRSTIYSLYVQFVTPCCSAGGDYYWACSTSVYWLTTVQQSNFLRIPSGHDIAHGAVVKVVSFLTFQTPSLSNASLTMPDAAAISLKYSNKSHDPHINPRAKQCLTLVRNSIPATERPSL